MQDYTDILQPEHLFERAAVRLAQYERKQQSTSEVAFRSVQVPEAGSELTPKKSSVQRTDSSAPSRFIFIGPRTRELANIRLSLRHERQVYSLARERLGASNKPGTTLCRSRCMGDLNRARSGLKKTMMNANKVLGRDTSRKIRKTK